MSLKQKTNSIDMNVCLCEKHFHYITIVYWLSLFKDEFQEGKKTLKISIVSDYQLKQNYYSFITIIQFEE